MCQQNMTHQVAVGLSTILCIKAGLNEEYGSKSKQENQRQPLLPLLRIPQEDHHACMSHNCNMHAEGLCQSHADSLVVSSVSVSPG